MAAAPPGQTSGSAGVQVCARRRAALRAAGRPRRPRARLRQHWVAVALVGGRALCWAAARGSPPGLMQLLGGEPTCLVRPLSGGAGGFGLEAPEPTGGVGGRHLRSGAVLSDPLLGY